MSKFKPGTVEKNSTIGPPSGIGKNGKNGKNGIGPPSGIGHT